MKKFEIPEIEVSVLATEEITNTIGNGSGGNSGGDI